jgi:hypothetical protein
MNQPVQVLPSFQMFVEYFTDGAPLGLALILKKEHTLEVQTYLHSFLEHGKNRLSTERTTVWFLGFNSKPRFHPLLQS